MTKAERAHAVIDRIAKRYTLETRAESGDGCEYLTADGRKCAVGAELTDEALEIAKDVYNGIGLLAFKIGEHVGDDVDEFMFKPESRGFPNIFWHKAQGLHDDPDYWDTEGLTWIGKEKVAYIKTWIDRQEGWNE